WSTLEPSAAVSIGPRAMLAVVAQNVRAPHHVRRLTSEICVHRLEIIEDGFALDRAFVEKVLPLARIRRIDDNRLHEHRLRDQVRTLISHRGDRGPAGGMAPGAHPAEVFL